MKDLRVVLIQTDIHWENIAANLQMLGERIRGIKETVDLIVLPEMFSTGFSMAPEWMAEPMDGSAMQWLKKMADLQNCVITGSLMLYEEQDGEKKYYNRLIWMRPDGDYEKYDKKHLFSLSTEPKLYTAGNGRLIVSINGWNVCPMICYDLRFPVWSRNAISETRMASYDVLLYTANWPERRSLAWRTLLQARAIENQCYIVGVNRVGRDDEGVEYTGDSSVIDPMGTILYRKEKDEEVAIVTLYYQDMVKARRQFTFLKDADGFELKS